jgi:hypothetical protein
MDNFALWPNRANYQQFREIMDDGSKYPIKFDQWEKTAKRQLADAKKQGIIIKPVPFDLDKFVAFCREHGLPCGGEGRAMYAITVGSATEMN